MVLVIGGILMNNSNGFKIVYPFATENVNGYLEAKR